LPRDYESLYKINRDIETTAAELDGRKVLYAHAYYPKEEFWKIYDEQAYHRLREKYHASRTFPNIYEKIFVRERYRAGVGRGLWLLFLKKVGVL